MLHEIDFAETNAKIEKYTRENVELIQRNAEFQQQESLMIAQILEDEKKDFRQRKEDDMKVIEQEHLEKERKKQTVIEQLVLNFLYSPFLCTFCTDRYTISENSNVLGCV